METVAIVGVGLIGGSFGLALKRAGFGGRILGVSSPGTIRKALERGAIDEAAALEEAAARADLIYVAGPIRAILETIPRLEEMVRPGALVTDAGSTKRQICAAGRALRRALFLGGHPMAGKEKRGVEEADAELFRGRPYLLTPADPQDLDQPAARQFAAWLERIGADVRVLAPDEHDRIVALSSHLPQTLSTALAATLAAHDDAPAVMAAAGPGLLDATRLALSGWDIWRDIFQKRTGTKSSAPSGFSRIICALKERLMAGLPEEEFRRGADFARRLRGLG